MTSKSDPFPRLDAIDDDLFYWPVHVAEHRGSASPWCAKLNCRLVLLYAHLRPRSMDDSRSCGGVIHSRWLEDVVREHLFDSATDDRLRPRMPRARNCAVLALPQIHSQRCPSNISIRRRAGAQPRLEAADHVADQISRGSVASACSIALRVSSLFPCASRWIYYNVAHIFRTYSLNQDPRRA